MSTLLRFLLLLPVLAIAPARAGVFILHNARVVDGSGAPAFHGFVVVSDDRIEAVGRGEPPQVAGAGVMDLYGQVLAPGFIDTHNHSDNAVMGLGGLESQLAQGITTVVVGVDGVSPWPLADYLARVEQALPPVNVAVLGGFGTIRERIMGADQKRPASAAETAAMTELADDICRAGAWGLSSGLEYEPDKFAPTAEIVAVARRVQPCGGIYVTHMRDEGLGILDSVAEAIRIGREAGIGVQISHIKMAYAPVWGQAGRALDMMAAARTAGTMVMADWYPYAAWESGIDVLVPSGDFGNTQRVAADLELAGGPARIQISGYPAGRDLEGLRLDAAAIRRGVTAVQLFQEIMQRGGASVIGHTMSADDLDAFARDPFVMVCSDGSQGYDSSGSPGFPHGHPRNAGAFPKVLREYVRERRVIALAEAIRKMTSLPAASYGFSQQGMIAAGNYADLVVLDPDRVRDHSTFETPGVLATGINGVWVNGGLVWSDARFTGERTGRVLRKQ